MKTKPINKDFMCRLLYAFMVHTSFVVSLLLSSSYWIHFIRNFNRVSAISFETHTELKNTPFMLFLWSKYECFLVVWIFVGIPGARCLVCKRSAIFQVPKFMCWRHNKWLNIRIIRLIYHDCFLHTIAKSSEMLREKAKIHNNSSIWQSFSVQWTNNAENNLAHCKAHSLHIH